MPGELTIQSIIRSHYGAYRRTRRVRADVECAARRIIDCRTENMGSHAERCSCGHISRTVYNSCRHRSCPACRGGRRAQWLQDLDGELLPCDHVHVIFTVPESLNILWRYNRRLFADLLLKASRQSLEQLLRDSKYLGATPAIISALHTWGRNLAIHPHAHCLVTAGGLNREGRFVEQKRATLLPARVLMKVFRGILRRMLLEALATTELSLPPSLSPARTRSLLNRVGRCTWNVRIQERYRNGVSVAGYLARYVSGGPISDKQLHDVTETEISFWYRDHRDGQRKLMRLSPDEFLTRWFEHVPPRGLRMIRRSGLYANCCRDKRREVRAALQTQPALTPATGRLTVPLEPERCPLCNTEVRPRDFVRPLRRMLVLRDVPQPQSQSP